MRVFLSGPTGSVKSTLAERVAERLSLPLVDLDAVIEAAQGTSVAALQARDGEAALRVVEADALNALLHAQPRAVVVLGQGAVRSTPLRHRLLRAGLLVTLRTRATEHAPRVGDGAGSPAEELAARANAYAECHAQLDTEAALDEQLAEIEALTRRSLVAVPLGLRSYCVEVGPGVRARALTLVAGRRVVLVTDDNVAPLWGEPLAQQLRDAGLAVLTVTLPAGEAHKTLRSVAHIWDRALDFGIDRDSIVISVGGGVVGDLAGFAAATLLRGIGVGHVPTSFLAMVDSSVGGKTGFDTEHGKNLVGAFHQPSFVLADVEVLETLPEAELRAGLAEVVKSAWIEGEAEVAELERNADALARFELEALSEAIHTSCRIKARIVTEDEREASVRAYLNLGHTVGHAIEAAAGYVGMRHGEAVALGCVAACRVAQRLGVMTSDQAQRMTQLLTRLGLPTEVEPHLRPSVLAYIARDKKRKGDGVRYVVPGRPGHIELHTLSLEGLAELLR